MRVTQTELSPSCCVAFLYACIGDSVRQSDLEDGAQVKDATDA